MVEEVCLRHDLDVVYAHIHGNPSEHTMFAIRKRALYLCRQHDVPRVLMDAREMVSFPSILSIYNFGTTFDRIYYQPVPKFAITGAKQMDHDLQFLEIVAQNRGIRLRRFDSVEDAVSWLKA